MGNVARVNLPNSAPAVSSGSEGVMLVGTAHCQWGRSQQGCYEQKKPEALRMAPESCLPWCCSC